MITGTLHEDQYTLMITSLSVLLRMKNFSHQSCKKKTKTHFIFNNVSFFRKSYRLWDSVEKYSTAGQAKEGNMVHVHCIPNTKGYKLTLRICNTYCFSTATIVARKRLRVTLYVHCLSVILLRNLLVYIYIYIYIWMLREVRFAVLTATMNHSVFWSAMPCNLVATFQNTPYHPPTHCRSSSKALSVRRRRWPALFRHVSRRPSMKHKCPKKPDTKCTTYFSETCGRWCLSDVKGEGEQQHCARATFTRMLQTAWHQCGLLVWYRYIRALSTFRAAHIPKHAASYAERTARTPETRDCDMQEELHHVGMRDHQTCTQGDFRSLFTVRAQVAIKNIPLGKIINYNTTGDRVIINNLVRLTS
jgi:hypothetical protein